MDHAFEGAVKGHVDAVVVLGAKYRVANAPLLSVRPARHLPVNRPTIIATLGLDQASAQGFSIWLMVPSTGENST